MPKKVVTAWDFFRGGSSKFTRDSTDRYKFFFLEIIKSAIKELDGVFADKASKETRARFECEVYDWITSPSTDFMSFKWVCEVVDLDPEYLKRKIFERMAIRHSGGRKYVRRNKC